MNKPDNYESEKAMELGTGYKTLEPGGYICIIKNVEATKSQAGNDMLRYLFDIYEGENKGFYEEQFNSDTREVKKWQGQSFQVNGGASTKFFKGFISAIERSNIGFVFDFDEQKLVGKLFGGLFGREEWFNSNKGEYLFNTKLFFVRDVATIRDGKFETPKDKIAVRTATPTWTADTSISDEDLPF